MPKGQKMSEEQREMMRVKMVGNKNHLGKHHSQETKNKMRVKKLGKPISEEHRKKIISGLVGRSVSEETKNKISTRLMGVHHSEKRKIKNSVAHKGIHHSEETKRKISVAFMGSNHPNWKGGISFAPYSADWTHTLRRSIRERDNYVCQLCGKLQGDKAFAVHHVDYDKKNCNPSNLITLCISCHMKTGFNRDYWSNNFKNERW